MITVTLENIINSAESLRALAQKELKGKTAYRVSRMLRELDSEYSLFNETRAELIKKYGVRDENGELVVSENGDYTLEKEHIEDFYKEINDLLKNEIELNVNKIDLDDLGDITFTPNEMLMLEPFIEE